MKFQQLVYVREVARSNLNVSQASKILYTYQPLIRKQIKIKRKYFLFIRDCKQSFLYP